MAEQQPSLENSGFASVLPLTKRLPLNPHQIVGAIGAILDPDLAAVSLLPGGVVDAPPKKRGLFDFSTPPTEIVNCAIGDIELEIASVSGRFKDSSIGVKDSIAGLINPAFWSDNLADAIDHRAYLRIRELRPEGAPSSDASDLFDRAAAVTIAAAAMAELANADAVIWVPARNLLPRRVFGQEVERLVDGLAPLRFWVRWHVIPVPPDDERTPGVATHGIADFAGVEMIVPPAHAERDAMIEQIFALASRLIDDQEEITEGAVVGDGAFTLSHAPAGEYCEPPCLVLTASSGAGPSAPSADRP